MENSNTAIATAAKGLTHEHYQHNSSSDEQSQIHHHHPILSFHSIIIIIVSIISVIVLVALFLLILLMIRRLKSSKHSNGRSFRDINSSSRFIAHTTINFTSSPDVKGGCLYKLPAATTANVKDKGVVQVFTYKELETATGKFSEGNVIGNGGFGVVYRGVLSDGTVAAINRLHIDGKQGERAFRMKVSVNLNVTSFIILFLFPFALIFLSIYSFLALPGLPLGRRKLQIT